MENEIEPNATARINAAHTAVFFKIKRQRGMGWIFSDFILSIIFLNYPWFKF